MYPQVSYVDGDVEDQEESGNLAFYAASINCLGRANRGVTTALRSLTPAQSAIHLKYIQVPKRCTRLEDTWL